MKYILRILWGGLLLGAITDSVDVLTGAASAGHNPWQVIVIVSASLPVSAWFLIRNFRNMFNDDRESPSHRDARKGVVRSTRNRIGNEGQQ